MRIGYSHWGFLGDGITDTPDGGRSHRKVLVDGLLAGGHDLVFLQANRDETESRSPVAGPYKWHAGLPEVDALFLEWRWRIPGRNDTACGSPGHTCDLHRQQELLHHYVHHLGLPTLLWDKDQQLAPDDPLRSAGNVTVCEPALHPRCGARSLLFPLADEAVDRADTRALAGKERRLPLVYVGNQYGRDIAFGEFFAPAARHFPHAVAGKWTDTARWPHVNFLGRVPFRQGVLLHQEAHATVLLAPERYASSGQFTQRIFESVLAGCAPITPAHYRAAGTVVPDELHAHHSTHVTGITHALTLMGVAERARLLDRCLRRLDLFRLSRQLDTIHAVFDHS
ncbi:hypothetical protein AB0939_09490 [Streptomyces sp. NPDC006990]|uniref:hypothetical protein n=1 Tax=Streptomyces sp. NPDC006990 TaxID=3154481 RepID=UPI003454927F